MAEAHVPPARAWKPPPARVRTARRAVPSWGCIACLDLVMLLAEGQRDWRVCLGEDHLRPP